MKPTPVLVIGSVGTDHHPFPRFLEWMLAAQHELGFEVLVQRGATPEFPGLPTVDYMPAPDLEARMAQASVVVCHGGPGTMSATMRCGHRPIVIARDPQLGEHVDDHQQRYTARLVAEGTIDSPRSAAELTELIRQAMTRPQTAGAQTTHVDRSVEAFSTLIRDFEAGRVPRRRFRDRVLIRRTP